MRAYAQNALLPMIVAAAAIAAYAVVEDKGLAAVGGALGAGLVAIGIWKRADIAFIASFGLLVCFPFFLGFSRTPKIFAEETLLLALLPVVILRILLHADRSRLALSDLFWTLLFLAMIGMVLIKKRPDNVALRNFIETFGLGVPLCLMSAQLATEATVRRVALVLCLAVIFVAGFGIVEVARKSNPIMKYVERHYGDEYAYLSPELAEAAGGTYRPYVVFFHPSEGGSVVALCLPFVAALLLDKRYRYFAAFALACGVAFVVVNATRGVWFSLAATAFLFVPQIRKATILSLPAAAIAAIIAPPLLGSTTFWERIADFRNLRIRFWYWDLALDRFGQEWLFGIGFGDFSKSYLASDPVIPPDIMADVEQVATVDNTYLMVLLEQGLIGIAGFFLLFIFLIGRLARARAASLARHSPMAAAFCLASLASLSIYLFCGLLADVHLFGKATKLVFMLIGLGWGLGLANPGEEKTA